VYDPAGAGELRAETELVVEVGGGVGVGLEIVDVARPPDDLEGIVAANVAHRAFALGETLSGRSAGDARLTVSGELRQTAPAAADPDAAVRAVAWLLEAVGERLEPGDRIFCGGLTHVPVSAGDHVLAEIDGLGQVELSIGRGAQAA
jgi:2-keto-4-pentenoate hydratase